MNMTAQPLGNPGSLSLPDLRAERDALRKQEDAVSFVRRLAQGRVDLVTAVRQHKADGTGTVSVAEIVRSGVGPAPSTGFLRSFVVATVTPVHAFAYRRSIER